MKYKVLPTKEILHLGRWFHAGQEVEMSEAEAAAFAGKIAAVGSVRRPQAKKAGIPKKASKTKPDSKSKRR